MTEYNCSTQYSEYCNLLSYPSVITAQVLSIGQERVCYIMEKRNIFIYLFN